MTKGTTFTKGDDLTKPDADMVSYGIHRVVDGVEDHGNIVEVHGDEKLRDKILMLLDLTVVVPRAKRL